MSAELQVSHTQIITPQLEKDESARLNELVRYQIHSLEPDPFLDDFTQLAAQLCSAPAAVLTVFKSESMRHLSRVGETLSPAIEAYLISSASLERKPFVVADTLSDLRFKEKVSSESEPAIRFYAGMPLATPEGQAIGVLSVFDHKPRRLSRAHARALASLTDAIMSRLELRRKRLELDQAVAERDKAFESLTASEERCSMLLRGASDGMWEWDLETNEMQFCAGWKAMLGYGEQELQHRPDEWFNRVHPEDIERVQSEIMSHLLGMTPQFQCEHRVRRNDGSYRWMLGRGLAVMDSNRHVYRMTGSLTDVTEQKQAEKNLLHNAFHDPLTALPNRVLFMERLTRKSTPNE